MRREIAKWFSTAWNNHKVLLLISIISFIGAISFGIWQAALGFQTQHISFILFTSCLGIFIPCFLVLLNVVRSHLNNYFMATIEHKYKDPILLNNSVDSFDSVSSFDELDPCVPVYECRHCHLEFPIEEFVEISADEAGPIIAKHPTFIMSVDGKYYSHICRECENQIEAKIQEKKSSNNY